MKVLSLMNSPFLFALLVILTGCGAPKEETTKANFKVSIGSLTGGSSTTQFPGGLMIYGQSDDKSFARILNSESMDETIPNGKWTFIGLGWDDYSAEKVKGKIYCAVTRVSLDGTPTEVSLNLSNKNCTDTIFGELADTGAENNFNFNTTIFACNKKGMDEANSTNSVCVYNPLTNDNYVNTRGHAKSFMLEVLTFDQGPNGIKIHDQSFKSCFSAGTPKIDMNFPSGVINKSPFKMKLTAYWKSPDCSQATNGNRGTKEIILHNGLNFNNSQGKSFSSSTSPSAIRKMFIRAEDSEICAENRGTFPDFATGDGSATNPYVICSPFQMNQAFNQNSSSYLLASPLNMMDEAAVIKGANKPECATDGGDNINPLGATCPSNVYSASSFTGTFDGNNYEIKNVILKKKESHGVGFVASLGANGKLLNLNLANPEIQGLSSVGAAVGRIQVGTVEKIQIYNSKIKGGNTSIGGVVGFMNSDTLLTSAVAHNMDIRGSGAVGGVVGNKPSPNGLDQLAASGILTASPNSSSEVSAGGIIGNYAGTNLANSYSNLYIVVECKNACVTSTSFVGVVNGGNAISGIAGYSNSVINKKGSGQENIQIRNNSYNTPSTNSIWVNIGHRYRFAFEPPHACEQSFAASSILSQKTNYNRGTLASPYFICNPAQLSEISNSNHDGYFEIKDVILANAANMDSSSSFSGVLNGNGQTIFGGSRLFDTIEAKGQVKNLNYYAVVQGTSGEGIADKAAALAIDHHGLIEKVRVSGDYFTHFESNSNPGYAGGLVYNVSQTGIIRHATFDGHLNSNRAGGIAYSNSGEIKWARTSVYATPRANAETFEFGGIVAVNNGIINQTRSRAEYYQSNLIASSEFFIGGLIGIQSGNEAKLINSVLDMNSRLQIKNSNQSVGGLIGYVNNSSIQNSYALGSIETQSNTKVGGLVGDDINFQNIQNFSLDKIHKHLIYPNSASGCNPILSADQVSLSFSSIITIPSLLATNNFYIYNQNDSNTPIAGPFNLITNVPEINIPTMIYDFQVVNCSQILSYSTNGNYWKFDILTNQSPLPIYGFNNIANFCPEATGANNQSNFKCQNGWDIVSLENGIGKDRLVNFHLARMNGETINYQSAPIWELDSGEGVPRLIQLEF